MNRISTLFAELANKTALISYITAGDPHPELTVDLMHTMVEAGVDLIELGVPFSDPMADGPTIQAACERALKHQVGLSDVLDMVANFRESNQTTPIILMGYANPLEIMGYQVFANRATQVGLDGVLTVDLPPEEATEPLQILQAANLDTIFLLSPTSSEERIEKICQVARGFVYYVSLKGVTGAANLDIQAVQQKLQQIRRHTSLPVGVGFGIKNADIAKAVGEIADAVVVGSAIINKIVEHLDDPNNIKTEIKQLLSSMRESLDLADDSAD